MKQNEMKFLVADDHAIVRKGLAQILCDEFPSAKVKEVSNSHEVMAEVKKEIWDVILLDISMPGRNGIEILKQLRADGVKAPVLMLSMHPEEQYAVRVFRAGAMAYLTKQTAPEELAKAVKQVLSGRRYVTASLGESMAGSLSRSPAGPAHPALSERELEVLVLLAQGQSLKNIAKSLILSVKTVSTYRGRLQDKLQLTTTAELIRYAIDHHLVD
jgi:DNA-binding NarL/FixJ family response regulator